MIVALLFLILFALLFPKALKLLLALMFLGSIMILGEVHAETYPYCHGDKSCNAEFKIEMATCFTRLVLHGFEADDPRYRVLCNELTIDKFKASNFPHIDCSGPIMKLPPGCETKFRDDESRPDINSLICKDIIGAGWDHMPNISDYIKTRPNADKLGYGSECHLGSLVFSQCWLEPHWPVTKAIDALLQKAATGKKLPDTPACGA
jgi:hypothetical protein